MAWNGRAPAARPLEAGKDFARALPAGSAVFLGAQSEEGDAAMQERMRRLKAAGIEGVRLDGIRTEERKRLVKKLGEDKRALRRVWVSAHGSYHRGPPPYTTIAWVGGAGGEKLSMDANTFAEHFRELLELLGLGAPWDGLEVVFCTCSSGADVLDRDGAVGPGLAQTLSARFPGMTVLGTALSGTASGGHTQDLGAWCNVWKNGAKVGEIDSTAVDYQYFVE